MQQGKEAKEKYYIENYLYTFIIVDSANGWRQCGVGESSAIVV